MVKKSKLFSLKNNNEEAKESKVPITFNRVASTPRNSWNLLEMDYTPGKTSWKIKKN